MISVTESLEEIQQYDNDMYPESRERQVLCQVCAKWVDAVECEIWQSSVDIPFHEGSVPVPNIRSSGNEKKFR